LDISEKSIDDINFVAFDLETTGLFPISSKIIEIGAVKFSTQGKISTFEALVNPEEPIPYDTYLIHGITQDMVKGKPTIEEVLPSFIEFLENSVLVAHHSIFDVSFISKNIAKCGLDTPNNIVLDTRILAKNIINSVEIENYKLNSLVKYFRIPSSTFHRAVYDAEYCGNVFINLIRLIRNGKNKFLLKDVLEYNNKPLDFNVVTKKEVAIPAFYLPLKKAIEKNQRINIIYKKANGEETNRDITPINILKLKSKIYVEAYCHLRREKRTFKLSKIIKIYDKVLK